MTSDFQVKNIVVKHTENADIIQTHWPGSFPIIINLLIQQ